MLSNHEYINKQISFHAFTFRGAEFAGPENNGPRKNNSWKMQNHENDGTNRKAGNNITMKMTNLKGCKQR